MNKRFSQFGSLVIFLFLTACGCQANLVNEQSSPTQTEVSTPVSALATKTHNSEPTSTPAAFQNPAATQTPSLGISEGAPKLFLTDGYSLLAVETDGRSPHELLTDVGFDLEYMTIDPRTNTLYLIQWNQSSQILQVPVSSPKDFRYFNGPDAGGQGLGIDSQAGKMFIGIYYAGIFVADLAGNGEWRQIVSSQDIYPLLGQRGHLQLDPVNKHIYFRTAFNGDCGECRWIYRVDYDGKNLTRIIKANGGDALALDLVEQKLYFSDFPGDNTIKRANLDGSNVETIIKLPESYVFCQSIAVDSVEQKLYLYLYETVTVGKKTVARVNFDGTGFEVIYGINSNRGNLHGDLVFSDMQTEALAAMPTLMPTAMPAVLDHCGGGWSRLEVGGYSSVARFPEIPNRVREAPTVSAAIIAKLPPGSIFQVIEGPVCADGFVYWKVASSLIPGGIGWTAEGDGKDYFLTSNHLLLSTPTDATAEVEIKDNRYVFKIQADRVMPEANRLKGGGRIDIIWFVDADNKKSTGQTFKGNDYNIHLTISELGWSAAVFPVSKIALEEEVQSKYTEINFKVDGLNAEVSFPVSFLPQENFTWWMEIVSVNSTEDWKKTLTYSVSLPEVKFTGK